MRLDCVCANPDDETGNAQMQQAPAFPKFTEGEVILSNQALKENLSEVSELDSEAFQQRLGDAADAAVREHAEHEGRHRMDPLLSELSHRLVSCAAFRGDRGGIGAGSFRTDQPALRAICGMATAAP